MKFSENSCHLVFWLGFAWGCRLQHIASGLQCLLFLSLSSCRCVFLARISFVLDLTQLVSNNIFALIYIRDEFVKIQLGRHHHAGICPGRYFDNNDAWPSRGQRHWPKKGKEDRREKTLLVKSLLSLCTSRWDILDERGISRYVPFCLRSIFYDLLFFV